MFWLFSWLSPGRLTLSEGLSDLPANGKRNHKSKVAAENEALNTLINP